MSAITREGGLLRLFGAIWILLAPVAFVMASISTVKSEVTYRVQLILFSVAALVALVAGIGGICRRVWAAYVLLTLSWIGVLYFFGTGIVLALWPLFPGSEATFQPLLFVVAGGIAVQGGAFLAMALFLRRCTKVSDVPSESA